MKEYITTSLYDTVIFRDKTELFTCPIGLKGKTYIDTNMVLGNQLPKSQSFIINHILYHCKEPMIFELVICSMPYHIIKIDRPFFIPILPISIDFSSNFCMKVCKERITKNSSKVFVSLIGELQRLIQ